MAKYKITYDREGCTKVGNCAAVANKFWKIAEDNKADLIGAVYNKETKLYELIIDKKYFDENKLAEEVCPVKVIKIEKIEE